MTDKANDFPRRARIDLFTPAEKAIYDAVQAVEAMPADVRLTDAVILLQRARDRVADYVDAIPTIPQGIYYHADHDNFYDANQGGMGEGFYNQWKDRRREFPQWVPPVYSR